MSENEGARGGSGKGRGRDRKAMRTGEGGRGRQGSGPGDRGKRKPQGSKRDDAARANARRDAQHGERPRQGGGSARSEGNPSGGRKDRRGPRHDRPPRLPSASVEPVAPAEPAIPARPAASLIPEHERRSAFVAVLGAPNAGKSTLVNALVGAKVAIVSRKVQTTRVAIRGIVMEGPAQLVFIDTPGLFAPKRRLDRAMVEAAASTAGEADVVAFVVDAAKGIESEVEAIVARLGGISSPRLLVLNKVDRVQKKEELLLLAADLNVRLAFDKTFMISAETGSGVPALRAHLAGLAPLGPWHYPEDDLTDATERTTAAEITRERIYDLLHDELPYAITVETTEFKELRDGGVRIEQTIFVERESQRRIVIGESASMVKQLSMQSRQELARIFERPVHLFLHVKVREGWENEPERYREMGLDFPKE